MARIWTNYSDQIIDLTLQERNERSDTMGMTYKRDDVDIPVLSHRQTAIVKHVWSLTREEKDWLSAYFLNKTKISRFLQLLEVDKREAMRLKVNNYSLILNFANGNIDYFRKVLEDEGDFWLLVSCRVNYKSNFYECLIKRVWNLTDTEERAVEI